MLKHINIQELDTKKQETLIFYPNFAYIITMLHERKVSNLLIAKLHS